jgi:hypothetical protein
MHLQSSYKHMVTHSDSTSAIERVSHIGAGPGQNTAKDIHRYVSLLSRTSRFVHIEWVKGHSGAPGNEAADALAGTEANKSRSSATVSLTSLKSMISSKYTDAKSAWSKDPRSERQRLNWHPASPEEVLLGQSEE